MLHMLLMLYHWMLVNYCDLRSKIASFNKMNIWLYWALDFDNVFLCLASAYKSCYESIFGEKYLQHLMAARNLTDYIKPVINSCQELKNNNQADPGPNYLMSVDAPHSSLVTSQQTQILPPLSLSVASSLDISGFLWRMCKSKSTKYHPSGKQFLTLYNRETWFAK